MKLSQAVREGCKQSLPTTVNLLERDSAGGLLACALGAAHLGIGGTPDMSDRDVYEELSEIWPELLTDCVTDEFIQSEVNLEVRLWHRSDTLLWTREAIADWLESEGY